jgi:hypothetical protein
MNPHDSLMRPSEGSQQEKMVQKNVKIREKSVQACPQYDSEEISKDNEAYKQILHYLEKDNLRQDTNIDELENELKRLREENTKMREQVRQPL